ncbi:MAG: hypothetical protein ACJ8J0_05420, partial [Longimicrobiaceae bacterium]
MEAGRAAERDGNRPGARESYEAALFRLRAPADAPLAASLLRWIARTHMDEGNLEAAGELAETALLVAEYAGDAAGVAHA